VKIRLGPEFPVRTGITCEYAGACRAPAAGELQAHNQREHGPWALCEEHMKPEFHPPDLHNKLVRWHRWRRP
jgi:hypothetical protein